MQWAWWRFGGGGGIGGSGGGDGGDSNGGVSGSVCGAVIVVVVVTILVVAESLWMIHSLRIVRFFFIFFLLLRFI